MTGNIRVSSSAQAGVGGQRSSQTLVARTILAAGLVLSILLAPFVIVDNDAIAAPIADHECEVCTIEATRFSDSGVGTLFVTKAARSAAASAARYSGLAAFYAMGDETIAGTRAARFNDSGVVSSLALREAARYSALTAFYTAEYRPKEEEISAAPFNDSGVLSSLALGDAARYSALTAFYSAEYRPAEEGIRASRYSDSGVGALLALGAPVQRAIQYNDSGVGAFFAAGEVARAIQ